MDEQLKQSALDFHEFPIPGKIQVVPTKPLATQRDLALAYSPGVAAPLFGDRRRSACCL
ncbi:NADP-dependent malic enzyme [Hafnia alvei]|uniref:NADP-dependent malic enzyme n=1 Tax=Hafnia alvei TaxID=569 RepID=A0A377PMK0_HAFAL|nr:NADP-dependent malic enzyme [Hafnia alvei]